ncbi:MAG: GLPGLI family protein [Prevotellaceae bacterium]|nr:GLPGLI family protein [Candidatus Minthosoma caballi]
MKTFFLTIIAMLMTFSAVAQTKDSVDVSQFTVVYDYACKTKMGKTGEDIIDTARIAVQVGTKMTRNMEYNWFAYWVRDQKKNQSYLYGMWDHAVNQLPEMVYVGYPEGSITNREGLVPKAYETCEQMGTINWTLTDDTLTICGYFCKSAVGEYAGRTWNAYYCEDIPKSVGPWKLHGLPGLILKADNGVHNFSLNSLTMEVLPIRFEQKPNYVKTDRDKYIKFRNNLVCSPRYVKDPVYWLSSGDNVRVNAFAYGEGDAPNQILYYNGIYAPNKDNVREYQPLELK